MIRWSPSITLVAAMVVFFVATTEAHPEWLRAVGLDCFGLADLHDAMARSKARCDELEGVRERVKARCRMREQVVADLLADRLDFFSAAARFQQLDGESPSVARVVELSCPGASPG